MKNVKVFLGTLCKRKHNYENTEKSLRYVNNPGSCVQCKSEQRQNWSKANPEKHKALKDKWHASHKDHHRKWKLDYRNEDPFRRAFLSIRNNSYLSKREIDVDVIYLKEIWENQKGKCYWLNVPLELNQERSHPAKATVDRIDSSKGYIRGNIVWACSFANLGRNKTSKLEFLKFLHGNHLITNS